VIRIPRAELDIQNSFRDIQQELNDLRSTIDRLGGSAAIHEPAKPDNRLPDDRLVFIASGTMHSVGLVPDPGSTAASANYLCENGTWSNATMARQPYSWRFSSGQLFLTTDTNLTSYDYTFAADGLKVGDTLSLFTSVTWQTTAGTKTLTLTVGTGAAKTMFSSTGVAANTLAHTRLDLFVRSTTALAIEGFTLISIDGAAFTETYFINTGVTVSDISANAQLFRWIGKNTGSATEAKMVDVYIRHFPANGNTAVV